MARTWLQVRVELVSGLGRRLEEPPGRVFIVGPTHTFGAPADAITAVYNKKLESVMKSTRYPGVYS